MNIAHKYVTYEIALMLKQKGFDEKCSHYYVTDFQNFKADGILKKTTLPEDLENENIFYFVDRSKQHHLLVAPEIWQVIEWLRLKHNIWISVNISAINKTFRFSIHSYQQKGSLDNIEKAGYNTPEESYLEAFRITLSELI